MEVSYTVHEKEFPPDLVVLEYATPLVQWLISDENPIAAANKLITPQDFFWSHLSMPMAIFLMP